jgi:hypothetical protein
MSFFGRRDVGRIKGYGGVSLDGGELGKCVRCLGCVCGFSENQTDCTPQYACEMRVRVRLVGSNPRVAVE